jgi:hypothetical protein
VRVLVLLGLLAACGGESTNDGGADGGRDMAVTVEDMPVPRDLAGADLTCTLRTFMGFPGTSASLRRLDCPCGCILDAFAGTTIGWWQPVTGPGASFSPTTSGLYATAAPTDAGTAVAGLSSVGLTYSFYLDGDFDLSVDWRFADVPPPDAHAIAKVLVVNGASNLGYSIERQRTLASVDEFTAQLGGIAPVSSATSEVSGTLRLVRTGFTIEAWANGTKVSQFTGATNARLGLILSAAQSEAGCAVDGGARPDGGACEVTVVWTNARLAVGSLVDRP